MKKLITYSILILSATVLAQDKIKTKITNNLPNFKISYFGRTDRYGVKISSDFTLSHRQISGTCKNGKSYEKHKERFLSTNLSLYDHASFYRNVMFSAELLGRTTYTSGLFIQTSLGIGYSTSIESYHPIFLKNADGSLTKKTSQNSNLVYIGSLGFGYDFNKKLNYPIKAFLNAGPNFIMYQGWPYPNIMYDLGVIVNLNTFKKN